MTIEKAIAAILSGIEKWQEDAMHEAQVHQDPEAGEEHLRQCLLPILQTMLRDQKIIAKRHSLDASYLRSRLTQLSKRFERDSTSNVGISDKLLLSRVAAAIRAEVEKPYVEAEIHTHDQPIRDERARGELLGPLTDKYGANDVVRALGVDPLGGKSRRRTDVPAER